MPQRVHDKLLLDRQSPHAIPLADELTNQMLEKIESDFDQSGAFVIPEQRLALQGTAGAITVTGNRRLEYEGLKYSYRSFQVNVLNLLLDAKDPIPASAIGSSLHFRVRQQYKAVQDLPRKTGATRRTQFMLHHSMDGSDFYSIRPDARFIDLRSPPNERLEVIRSMCKQFGNDPYVLRHLERYSCQTLEFLPDHWDADQISRYQLKSFEPLENEHESKLMQLFRDVVDRRMRGDASKDEQLRAVIAYNQLVYSYLALSNHLVLESAGIAKKKGWNPLAGFIQRYADHGLSRPLADAKQFGAIGVIKAIQSFDPSRGALPTHVIRCVEAEVRRGFIELTRHTSGHTRHEAEGSVSATANRRYFFQDDEEYENHLNSTASAALEYEKIVADTSIAGLVHATLNDAEMRLTDQLILSLSTGIYVVSLEGRQLQGANGKKFIYDEKLKTNEIFRAGMTDKDLGDMFELSPITVARLRRNVFERFENMLRVRLSSIYYGGKWHNVHEWLS